MTVPGAVNIGLNEELGLKKWKWNIVRPTDLRLDPLYTKVFQIYKTIIGKYVSFRYPPLCQSV